MERMAEALTERQGRILRVLLAGACFVVVVAGLKVAAPILNLVLLGALVAQTLSPLPMWLMRRGFNPGSSVLISILVVIAGGLLLVVGFSLSTARLVDRLPAYQEGLVAMRDKLTAGLTARGIDVSQIPLFQPLDPARAMTAARAFLGGLASALGSSILVILIAAVVVYELTVMRANTDRQAVAGSLAARFDAVTADSRQYIALTGLVGLMQAGAILVVLLLAGVDAPITWAVLFFFFQFIPGIGIPIALTAPALLALLEHGWQRALVVVLGCWFVNLVGDNVIKPKYYVTGLDLSLTTMVFALIFWTWVLGPAGTILAVPLALTLKRLTAATAA
jgi:predicted PurR-regulated permease PerM